MPAIVSAVALPMLLALVVALLVIGVLWRSRVAVLILDQPNQRSLHVTPKPRIGGIGIITGMVAACLYAGVVADTRVIFALLLLIGISLLDDVRSIGVVWRMLAHLATAALAASVFVFDAHGIWAALAATFAIAWMTNLYNFMDGSDGLAGGMAAFGFGTFGIAALYANDIPFATVNFSVTAAAVGFLFFNFPPARVFMGDAGAIPLGFLAAVCALAGWQRGIWPLWFGSVVFSPFIVDATLTLVRRLLRGARIWQAHREHYYQRLVRSGWGHRKTLFAEFGLMITVCAIALAGFRLDPASQTGVLLAVAILYVLLVVNLERSLGASQLENA